MAYQSHYPHLFEPLYVGKHQIEFKNRVFMAPMSTEHDPASHVMLDESMEFYAMRARGGAGCVHVGETRFDLKTCAAHPAQLDLTDIRTLPLGESIPVCAAWMQDNLNPLIRVFAEEIAEAWRWRI